MSTERTLRYTAWTALATSTCALGLSIWSAGCERTASAQPKEEAPLAAPAAPEARDAQPKGEAAAPVTLKTEATPRQEAAAPKEPGVRQAHLEVKRLVVVHAVEGREPVAVQTLTAAEPVVAFVQVANADAEAGKLVVTFERAGQEPVGHIELAVPGKQARWRTWGRTKMIKTAGEWQAVVRAEDGTELARQPFTVVAPPPSAARAAAPVAAAK